ncbi:MAG: DUF559 domain-containing protein, partial [Terriglobia bacterium]
VYSLDPNADLRPGDLRRQLVEYAVDPGAVIRMLKSEEARVESELERLVMRRLVAAGYRVFAQWPVGSLRIDLVVEGAGRRLAIECDGDRYHPIEKLPEDMARQAVLERTGWRFARVRGSHFFRDPDGAMRPVLERLVQLEIAPEVGGNDEHRPVAEADSLKDQVLSRAATLLQQWDESSEQKISIGETPATSARDMKTTPRLSSPEATHGTNPGTQNPGTQNPGTQNPAISGPVSSQPNQLTPIPKPDGGREDSQTTLEDAELLVKWVSSVDPKIWFGMARWAKEKNHLNPWERSLLFNMGVYVSRSLQVSDRQARQARRIYDQVSQLGFNPSRDILQ